MKVTSDKQNNPYLIPCYTITPPFPPLSVCVTCARIVMCQVREHIHSATHTHNLHQLARDCTLNAHTHNTHFQRMHTHNTKTRINTRKYTQKTHASTHNTHTCTNTQHTRALPTPLSLKNAPPGPPALPKRRRTRGGDTPPRSSVSLRRRQFLQLDASFPQKTMRWRCDNSLITPPSNVAKDP